jgi:hypothetical protein
MQAHSLMRMVLLRPFGWDTFANRMPMNLQGAAAHYRYTTQQASRAYQLECETIIQCHGLCRQSNMASTQQPPHMTI